jgi:hypothetical protein
VPIERNSSGPLMGFMLTDLSGQPKQVELAAADAYDTELS